MKCKECDALKDEILQLQKLLLLTQEEMINEMTDRVDSENLSFWEKYLRVPLFLSGVFALNLIIMFSLLSLAGMW